MSDGGGAHTPHSPNMLRNVLTGVITTILGATAVYYLGFSKHGSGDSSSHGYLETKEATTKAWKSYVAIENLEYKNTMLLANHMKDLNGLDEFKEELTKESNKFCTDIEALLKNEEIDDGFTSLLKRRLDAEKEAMKKWNDFFDKCSGIINSTQQGQERSQQITAEYNKMQSAGGLILERTKNEVTDLSKSLSEKYGQPFAVTDLMLFQDQKKTNENTNITNTVGGNENGNSTVAVNTNNNNNPNDNTVNNYNKENVDYTNNTMMSAKKLAGEWDTPGAVITLTANGQMSWQQDNGLATSGTWQFYNNQLYMTYPNNYGVTGTYVFNLSNITANSFTMTLVTYPYYRYDLTRYNDNY